MQHDAHKRLFKACQLSLTLKLARMDLSDLPARLLQQPIEGRPGRQGQHRVVTNPAAYSLMGINRRMVPG